MPLGHVSDHAEADRLGHDLEQVLLRFFLRDVEFGLVLQLPVGVDPRVDAAEPSPGTARVSVQAGGSLNTFWKIVFGDGT